MHAKTNLMRVVLLYLLLTLNKQWVTQVSAWQEKACKMWDICSWLTTKVADGLFHVVNENSETALNNT